MMQLASYFPNLGGLYETSCIKFYKFMNLKICWYYALFNFAFKFSSNASKNSSVYK